MLSALRYFAPSIKSGGVLFFTTKFAISAKSGHLLGLGFRGHVISLFGENNPRRLSATVISIKPGFLHCVENFSRKALHASRTRL
jgi:hypothetical protein